MSTMSAIFGLSTSFFTLLHQILFRFYLQRWWAV